MSKIAFLHTSKQIDEKNEILIMPIGLIALANFIKENGFDSEIIHLNLEKELDSNFDLFSYLRKNNIRIFLLPLHWHQQSTSTIDLVKQIKNKIDNSIVILGGFTATYYSNEIMENFTEVDFIIKGDSEIPLLELFNSLFGDKDFASIPNLVWRNGSFVKNNHHTYVTTQEVIDALNFTDFSLVKNYEIYNKIRINNLDSMSSRDIDKMFYYNTGRGCPINCSFCGGSNISQKIINGRGSIIKISDSSVLRELKKAKSNNLKIWYTCFDPTPKTNYYPNLFKKIRDAHIDISLQFECWALPSKKFIDEFKDTFSDEHSQIIISPETGSNKIRKLNKGFYYTNRQLFDCLEYLVKKDIDIVLYFTAGLPFESKNDILETAKVIKYIKKKYEDSKIEINVLPIGIEPVSPLFLDTDKYGIISKKFSFLELYETHKHIDDPEYETSLLSKNEIKKFIAALQKLATN